MILFVLSAALAEVPASAWGPPGRLDALSPRESCEQAAGAAAGHPEDAVLAARRARICRWTAMSDGGLYGSFGVGTSAALLVATDFGEGPFRAAPPLAYAGGALATGLATGLVKRTALRPRPYTGSARYVGPASCGRGDLGQGRDACRSFFSGHAAFTAYNLFYAASALDVRQTDEAWTTLATGYAVATLGTGLVAGARVGAGRHFWSDVAVGALVGAGLGLAAPRLAELATPAGPWETPSPAPR